MNRYQIIMNHVADAYRGDERTLWECLAADVRGAGDTRNLVEGGSFACYAEEQNELLDSLFGKPKKARSSDMIFRQYVYHVSRAIEKFLWKRAPATVEARPKYLRMYRASSKYVDCMTAVFLKPEVFSSKEYAGRVWYVSASETGAGVYQHGEAEKHSFYAGKPCAWESVSLELRRQLVDEYNGIWGNLP